VLTRVSSGRSQPPDSGPAVLKFWGVSPAVAQCHGRSRGCYRPRGNRNGHRDATMILIAFGRGLRAAMELVPKLRPGRSFARATLHVRRLKSGTRSFHPLTGPGAASPPAVDSGSRSPCHSSWCPKGECRPWSGRRFGRKMRRTIRHPFAPGYPPGVSCLAAGNSRHCIRAAAGPSERGRTLPAAQVRLG